MKQLGFSAPPKTLDEMEAMMKKGKETIPDLIGLQLDTTIRTIGFTHQWAFMNAFEYEPIKGTTVKFNTPGMVQYGEWIRRTVKNGYTLPGKRFGEFRPLAAQGRVLFAYDGSGQPRADEGFQQGADRRGIRRDLGSRAAADGTDRQETSRHPTTTRW